MHAHIHTPHACPYMYAHMHCVYVYTYIHMYIHVCIYLTINKIASCAGTRQTSFLTFYVGTHMQTHAHMWVYILTSYRATIFPFSFSSVIIRKY